VACDDARSPARTLGALVTRMRIWQAVEQESLAAVEGLARVRLPEPRLGQHGQRVTSELWIARLKRPKNHSIHTVTSGYEIWKSLPAPVSGCSAWFGCIVSGFLAPETFIRFN